MTEQTSQERTLFQEGDVQITDKRVVLGSKTYSMANITSVSTVEVKPMVALPIVMIALGGISIIVYIYMLTEAESVTGLLALGLILGGAGGIWYASKRGSIYIVRIGSASGEVDGMISKDRNLIDRIVKAINNAIVMGS